MKWTFFNLVGVYLEFIFVARSVLNRKFCPQSVWVQKDPPLLPPFFTHILRAFRLILGECEMTHKDTRQAYQNYITRVKVTLRFSPFTMATFAFGSE